MQSLFKELFNWAEVWGLLIPLSVWLFKPKQPSYFTPVIIYLFIALLLNFFADLIWQAEHLHIKLPTDNNNPLYNINSILRMLLFSWFFVKLNPPYSLFVKKIIPAFFIGFLVINFMFFENFFARVISSRTLLLESALLLFYCFQYYLHLVKIEQTEFKKHAPFWLITGLCIFIMADQPVYLFYDILIKHDIHFAEQIWVVPRIAYLIFCIFTAKALYAAKQ